MLRKKRYGRWVDAATCHDEFGFEESAPTSRLTASTLSRTRNVLGLHGVEKAKNEVDAAILSGIGSEAAVGTCFACLGFGLLMTEVGTSE
ncbi:hypothetical protein L7F22_045174 [Adiantum nelumboides]|nr:hypothetical protein [Adiantum nelumboides]